MYFSRQKCASAYHNLRAVNDVVVFWDGTLEGNMEGRRRLTEFYTDNLSPWVVGFRVEKQIKHIPSADIETGIVGKEFLHVLLVQFSIYLCSWALSTLA